MNCLNPIKTALIFMLLCGIFSCNKNTNKSTTATYHITYTGSCYLGSTIVFSTNAPAGSSLLWKFSDSTTSTEISPAHIFPSSGIYSVKLIINGDSINYLFKSLGIGLDSTQMPIISGTKTWSHSLHFQASPDTGSASGYLIDTIYSKADTTFPVSWINGGNILILNDTLEFSKTGGDTVIYFAAPVRFYRIYPTAAYFRNTGKIEYYITDLISSGSKSTETYSSH